MKQNIYDNPEFFAGYMALRAAESGLNVAVEEPAVRSLLPNIAGRAVADVGCGFGKFAGYCHDHDVRRFAGFDISEKMIHQARARYADERISFCAVAVEDMELEYEAFDIVVSSMCLHYVQDIDSVLRSIADGLRPGGRLVLSVEHPVCTALMHGWYNDGSTADAHWPMDRYFDESVRYARWFVDGVIKYHRTVESYVRAALGAGLSLADLREPKPTEAAVAKQPALAAHRRRPCLLVMACDKPAVA